MFRYVQDGLANGKTKDQLQKDLLLAGGWQVSDIDEVFAAVEGRMVTRPKKKSPLAGILVFLIILAAVAYGAWHFYGPQIQARIEAFTNPALTAEPIVETPTPEPIVEPVVTSEVAPDPYAVGTPAYIAIEALVKKANPDAGRDRSIGIGERTDITGDGIPELIVNDGVVGAEDHNYIVRFENEIPVLVKVNYKGKVSTFSGMSGSAAVGKKADTVQLLAQQQAILVTSYSVYGEQKDYCVAIAYVWNPTTKIFEYNKQLSDQKISELMTTCLQVATDNGVTYKGK